MPSSVVKQLQRFDGSLIAIARCGLARASRPPQPRQTIDDIIKRGTVIVGVNTTTPIFGLVGKDGQPEGYDPDVARLLGKYLGVPGRVRAGHRRQPHPAPAERPGRHDDRLFGITPERAQQVWYSIPYARRCGDAGRRRQAARSSRSTILPGYASACRAAPCRT